MSCRKILKLLALHVGGDLPERAAARVEEHLGVCPGCRDELRRYEASRQTLFSLKGGEGAAPDLWPALRMRIRRSPPPRRMELHWRAAAAILLLAGLAAAGSLALRGPGESGRQPLVTPEPVAGIAEPATGSVEPPADAAEPPPVQFVLAEAVAEIRHDPFPEVSPLDPDRGDWDEF